MLELSLGPESIGQWRLDRYGILQAVRDKQENRWKPPKGSTARVIGYTSGSTFSGLNIPDPNSFRTRPKVGYHMVYMTNKGVEISMFTISKVIRV